jgi:hypothetical protein
MMRFSISNSRRTFGELMPLMNQAAALHLWQPYVCGGGQYMAISIPCIMAGCDGRQRVAASSFNFSVASSVTFMTSGS